MILDMFCKCGKPLEIRNLELTTLSDMRIEVTVKPCVDCLSEAKDMGREDAGKEEA